MRTKPVFVSGIHQQTHKYAHRTLVEAASKAKGICWTWRKTQLRKAKHWYKTQTLARYEIWIKATAFWMRRSPLWVDVISIMFPLKKSGCSGSKILIINHAMSSGVPLMRSDHAADARCHPISAVALLFNAKTVFKLVHW